MCHGRIPPPVGNADSRACHSARPKLNVERERHDIKRLIETDTKVLDERKDTHSYDASRFGRSDPFTESGGGVTAITRHLAD